MGRRPKEPISPRLGTDRTHTIASLLFSGAAERFPDVKWIFSHAGGPAPFLMQRFTYYFAARKGPACYLERFYYDLHNAAPPAVY